MRTKNSTAAKKVQRKLDIKDGLFNEDSTMKRNIIIMVVILGIIILSGVGYSLFA